MSCVSSVTCFSRADIWGSALSLVCMSASFLAGRANALALFKDSLSNSLSLPGNWVIVFVKSEPCTSCVLVDISIDQGGCFETSKATTHADPTYVVDEVVHYCVANMPGAVARTSTFALNNATLPFTLAIADKGYKAALLDNPYLLAGLNVHKGQLTYQAVADALGIDAHDARGVLSV